MENKNFNFESERPAVLTKRPNAENQRKKTFSVSMHDFLGLVQGQYKAVELYDSSNRLKLTISREDVLSKGIITPYVNHMNDCAIYLVNYSEIA